MKILITGSFCSGKTTLANQLQLKLENSTLVQEVTREVLKLFGKVDWSLPELRDYIFIKQLIEEAKAYSLKYKFTIVDAGIISLLAHDSVLLKSPPDRTKLMKYFCHAKYDLIFFCDHNEIPMTDDGERFINENLRDDIGSSVKEILSSLDFKDYFVLKGSELERLNYALQLLI